MMDGHEEYLSTTVTNYRFDKDGNYFPSRFTVQAHMVMTIEACRTTTQVEGRELMDVVVSLLEGKDIRLFISEVDLISLERAIGTVQL